MRILLLISLWLAQPLPTSAVQRCNTNCQSAHTDCILACDGDLACAKQCHQTTESCVKRCTTP
ncbi:MAG TPA: hypothetical protein PKD61_32755 [Polyangiaceae bacterium]|nr:hypothetical protein [Polyangiaceae bacterium]